MKKLLLITAIASLTFAAQNTKQAVVNVEQANQNELHMVLESSQDVYGLQFDITYNANHISLSEENIAHMFTTNDSRSNMSVYSKVKPEEGTARVIVFDLGGQSLLTAENLEKVVKLSYDVVEGYKGNTSITIDNIVAAGQQGQEVEATDSFELTFGTEAANTSNDFSNAPEKTQIKGNYPNPFNPRTEIKFDLSKQNEGLVEVAIYNVTGQRVATLHNDITSAGYHTYTFDAHNLSSGQYFVRVTAPGFSDVRPMTFLK